MDILGLSAFYHDSAACLLRDGEIIVAAQEERFTRKKHDERFPSSAIAFCLRAGGVRCMDLDYVAYYDKPLLTFERLLETYLAFAPSGLRSFIAAMPVWLKEKLFIKKILRDELAKIDGSRYDGPIIFSEHHESHAASAFYCSPFDRAAVLTVDGVGEWATTSLGRGNGSALEFLKEIRFPHSLGLLYSAFTYYTGFRVNSGEYKVMGLAPYGEPKYVQTIRDHLIDLKEDGSFRLNQEYFNYCTGLTMTSAKFNALFGGPPRKPESKLTQREMDLARSVQDVTEEVMLRLVRTLHRETGEENLCMAGGVALNCVANGRILREGPFKRLWVQPAAGDAGGSVGAALVCWHRYLGRSRPPRTTDTMRGVYLGPKFSDEDIRAFLDENKIAYTWHQDEDALLEAVAGYLAGEKVVGWFQGRMEFGPRALGNRSILGDARSPTMQATMNLKIKFRESFRPFAPSVLYGRTLEYFDLACESPYMLLVANVQPARRKVMNEEDQRRWGIEQLNVPRSDIPAVTHIDYSARIQTVHRETNPRYHALLERFATKTGCPVLVNTSFNVRGEPIVCTPEDAYRCFMRTNMDYLVLGSVILDKRLMPTQTEPQDWRKEFTLD